MSIYRNFSNLPEKIKQNLTTKNIDLFIAAFKTNIKPNDTIPLLWIVFYNDKIVFCSTHKTRGIYNTITINEIDSFRIILSEYAPVTFQIIFKDIEKNDLYIETPQGIFCENIKEILLNYKVQIL